SSPRRASTTCPPRADMGATPLRVLMIIQRAGSEHGYMAPYVRALTRRFDTAVLYVEDHWPRSTSDFPPGHDFDVCLWFVKFRELAIQPPFDWGSFSGLRAMHDHDAYLSYGTMGLPSPYLGAWPKVFRQQRFDLLLTSGKRVAELLADDGV